MKKLLALILCVMMFVSVISTSAFANYDHTDQRTWKGESQNKKIVEALRTNLNNIYGSYAVDTAVFKSVKTIDDMLKDMVDKMLEDYAPNINGTTTSSSAINDAILAGLRSTVGGEITDYLDKHQADFYVTDSLGHRVFNPAGYAGAFATAASKALTSGKAIAGIQAYMIYAANRAAFNNFSQQAADLRNEIIAWNHLGDYGWDDATKGIHAWHVPLTDMDGTYNLDGVLHGIGDSYASVLSVLGQLGVDLDADAAFGLGFNGLVNTVDGTVVTSTASENETVVTPLKNSGTTDLDGAWFLGDTDAEVNWETYEGLSETDYIDNNPNFFPWFMGDGTVDVVTTNPGLVFGS
jgi:hypothetical protein